MKKKIDLKSLIAELKQAKEGSRELDGDIAEQLGFAEEATKDVFGMKRRENQKRSVYAPVDRGEWARSIPTNESWKAPYFTTSLDAKLPWENIRAVNYDHVSKNWMAAHAGEKSITWEIGKTEPLVRRIAALKARDHA